jgi:hypothetical protein
VEGLFYDPIAQTLGYQNPRGMAVLSLIPAGTAATNLGLVKASP